MNMGHCRFHNTLGDLQDVCDHMDESLSTDEHKARKKLIELCAEIAEQYGDDADSLPVEDDEDEDET